MAGPQRMEYWFVLCTVSSREFGTLQMPFITGLRNENTINAGLIPFIRIKREKEIDFCKQAISRPQIRRHIT